jgi:precorrin-6A/cobalt-precorrin-6A reductase
MSSPTLTVLVLGGTTEGRLLAERLAADARCAPLLSFAGRTARLPALAVPHRTGGFGGPSGLAAFLRAHRIAALVDATHPFASRMTANAVEAAAQVGVPLLRIERPPWRRRPGDNWIEVATMDEAARALGTAPRRVFLTIGRQEVDAFLAAPQHRYLVRAVDDFPLRLPHGRVIAARGPFALTDERRLLVEHGIEILVSKNSGTDATYAKIDAARERNLPVVMVQRPPTVAAATVATVEAALAWIARFHDASPSRRGE